MLVVFSLLLLSQHQSCATASVIRYRKSRPFPSIWFGIFVSGNFNILFSEIYCGGRSNLLVPTNVDLPDDANVVRIGGIG